MPRPRRRLDAEYRPEHQRVLLRGHRLRNLLVIDQRLEQAAGLAAAKHRRGDVRIGVPGREERRSDPRHVDARQLDAILHHGTALLRDRRRLDRWLRHRRPLLEGPEVLLDQRLRLGLVDIANDGQAGVVGRVVGLEELLHVFEFRRLDIGVRSDHGREVGMRLRKELMEHRLFDDAVGLVLDALTPLISNHVLLIGEVGLIDLVKQITHPVGLQPEPQFQLIGRQRLEIVGAVKVRGAIHAAGASALERLEVEVSWHVLGALKHHVLEQVCESGAPRFFVGRPDVIPEVHGDQRQAVIF